MFVGDQHYYGIINNACISRNLFYFACNQVNGVHKKIGTGDSQWCTCFSMDV
jgi:hypothetical protein